MALNNLNFNTDNLSTELSNYIETKKEQFKKFKKPDFQTNAIKTEIENYLSAVFSNDTTQNKYKYIKEIQETVEDLTKQNNTSIINSVEKIDWSSGNIQMAMTEDTKEELEAIKESFNQLKKDEITIENINKQIINLNVFLEKISTENLVTAAANKLKKIKEDVNILANNYKGKEKLKNKQEGKNFLSELSKIINAVESYNKTNLIGNILEYVLALMPIAIGWTAIDNANNITKEMIKTISTNQLGEQKQSVSFIVPRNIDNVNCTDAFKKALNNLNGYTNLGEDDKGNIVVTGPKTQVKVDIRFNINNEVENQLNISAKHYSSSSSIHLVKNSPLINFLNNNDFAQCLLKTSALLTITNDDNNNDNILKKIKQQICNATLLTVVHQSLEGGHNDYKANIIIVRNSKNSDVHIYQINEILQNILEHIGNKGTIKRYIDFYLNGNQKFENKKFIENLKINNIINNNNINQDMLYAAALSRFKEIKFSTSLKLNKYIKDTQKTS